MRVLVYRSRICRQYLRVLLPEARALGIDPILFGVIMTVNLAIGFCTLPLGVNLFVASSISGRRAM